MTKLQTLPPIALALVTACSIEGSGQVGQGITSPGFGDDSGVGGGAGGGGSPDDGSCGCGNADLVYNVDLALGQTFKLTDAFLMKSPYLPKAIISLEMQSPPEWRLAELVANTPYVVDQDDCDHDGNHGQGRDRYEITWENADGSTESDHFTIRYCEGSGDQPMAPANSGDCECIATTTSGTSSATTAVTSTVATSATSGGGCVLECVTEADCGGFACVTGCCSQIPQ